MPALLASVDAAWLRMDDPAGTMVVTGVLVLDAPVSTGQVRDWLERRFLAFPRFTRRVVQPPGGVGLPAWEPDPQFSIDHHEFELELPPPADGRALQARVALRGDNINFISLPSIGYPYSGFSIPLTID